MESIKFPMHKETGKIIQLADILALLPENDWVWALLFFYGVGKPPIEINMSDFESLVRSAPKGYLFSWSTLKAFAADLIQTYDCLLIAVSSEDDILRNEIKKNKFDQCILMIEGFDCTSWVCIAPEKNNTAFSFGKFKEKINNVGGSYPKSKYVLGPAQSLKYSK